MLTAALCRPSKWNVSPDQFRCHSCPCVEVPSETAQKHLHLTTGTSSNSTQEHNRPNPRRGKWGTRLFPPL